MTTKDDHVAPGPRLKPDADETSAAATSAHLQQQHSASHAVPSARPPSSSSSQSPTAKPPGRSSAATTTNEASLSVAYVTSSSIFIPDVGNAAASSSTMLSNLSCENGTNMQSLAGATTPAGSGLLVHIFMTTSTADEMSKAEEQQQHEDPQQQQRQNQNHQHRPVTKRVPDPPPLVAVLDEEEAAERASSPNVARIEQRVMAAQKVLALRFAGSSEERDRFLQQSAVVGGGGGETQLLQGLVDGSKHSASSNQQLRAVAGTLVGFLPHLRCSRFTEGSTFMKVDVR